MVVQADQEDLSEATCFDLRSSETFKVTDRPFHSFNATDSIEIRFGEWFDFVRVLLVRVHHPDLSVANINRGMSRSAHQANENGRLL